ncbi:MULTISPECIES: hypothetical protein [unclassified Streptomyces]|uniref:hypothetical protein n=1 Tax=unclassified Streptomyces TaxID=2593676 RepID=UPI0036EEBC9F
MRRKSDTRGKRALGLWAAGAVVAAGGSVAVARAKGRASGGAEKAEEGRWHVITVGRPRPELMPDGKLPPPLDGLGDHVEIRAADAPGGRGTEIAARRTGARDDVEGMESEAGASTDERIREALREFKQLTETNEVLRTEGQPTGKRRPGGIPLARASRRARKEGLL